MTKARLYTFGKPVAATAKVVNAATPGKYWVETKMRGRPEALYSGLKDGSEILGLMQGLARVFGGGDIKVVDDV
jgi:hypothetical protein